MQATGRLSGSSNRGVKPAEPDRDDPDGVATVLTDPLANLFDEADADDEKLGIMLSDGDNPPYDEDDVPGDGSTGLERMAMAATSTSNPIVPFGGFIAPHGLIQVVATQSSGSGVCTLLMDVEAVGGIY